MHSYKVNEFKFKIWISRYHDDAETFQKQKTHTTSKFSAVTRLYKREEIKTKRKEEKKQILTSTTKGKLGPSH